jgi:hypothetical protein
VGGCPKPTWRRHCLALEAEREVPLVPTKSVVVGLSSSVEKLSRVHWWLEVAWREPRLSWPRKVSYDKKGGMEDGDEFMEGSLEARHLLLNPKYGRNSTTIVLLLVAFVGDRLEAMANRPWQSQALE